MHVRNLPEVAEVFVNVFLLRFFVDARREDDPPFDGFLWFAVPFVGRSQTVVSVVPGVLDLGVDDVGVLEATALVEEKTRARARVYICVSSKSFHFEERERERQKCVPNRSSFLLRVKGVCIVLLLLLLLLFGLVLKISLRALE